VGQGRERRRHQAELIARHFSTSVMRGHSGPKDGVASLAYDPRIHRLRKMDGRVKPGHDAEIAITPPA
jgi:hypothetical protein